VQRLTGNQDSTPAKPKIWEVQLKQADLHGSLEGCLFWYLWNCTKQCW